RACVDPRSEHHQLAGRPDCCAAVRADLGAFPAARAADRDRMGTGARQHRASGARSSLAPAYAGVGDMIVEEDIAAVVASLAPVWPKLDGARIFFTGGTGFIGCWMLEILARAPVRAEVLVLS